MLIEKEHFLGAAPHPKGTSESSSPHRQIFLACETFLLKQPFFTKCSGMG
jgi:hypothetical protein